MKKKPIGIKDIANYAGVSTGPVDKVLNNRGSVSVATREKILKAIKELDYKPNILASRLKSNKEYKIAVLIPEATQEIPYWKEHERGLSDAVETLSPYGIQVNIHRFPQNEREEFRNKIAEIQNSDIDALFMVPVFKEESISFINTIKKKNIPIVFFDTQLIEFPKIPFIGQHSFDSGFLAAELINKSIQEEGQVLIVKLTDKEDNHSHFKSREEGFKTYFQNTPRIILKYETDINNKLLKSEINDLINSNQKIEGIFVTNGVHKVSKVLIKHSKIKLLGYDLIEENIKNLKKGKIDYLISQQPYNQAFNGLHLFYDQLILKKEINPDNFLPIDIVMKTNLKYYNNYQK